MGRTSHQPSQTKFMWNKSRDKKAAKMYHSRNFGTGWVEPDLHFLSRVGLRGRKRWIFLCVVVIIYLLTIAHLLLTCTILGVLHFDSTGPRDLIFQKDGSLLWPNGAELREVVAEGNLIQAYHDHPLSIGGQKGHQVIFQAGGQQHSAIDGSLLNSTQVLLSPSNVELRPFRSLTVSQADRELLSVSSSVVVMKNLQSLNDLIVDSSLRTSYVRAPLGSDIGVKSDNSLNIYGAGGVGIAGSQVNITSAGNVSLSSQGSIYISSGEGVQLSEIPRQGAPPPLSATYHLCACSINGRLFLVPFNPLRCAGTNDFDSICSHNL